MPIRSARVILSAFLSAGCGADAVPLGEAMSLGEPVVRLDLAGCYGTRCDPPTVEPVELRERTLSPCTVEDAPPLVPAWTVPPRFLRTHVDVGPDDALWVVSLDAGNPATFERFGPDGEQLAAAELDYDFSSQDLSSRGAQLLRVSSAGHAFIVDTEVVTDVDRGLYEAYQHVVLQVDDQGALMREPLPIDGTAGPLTIGTGADGSLLLSASNEAGATVLARLDAHGVSRWVQSAVRQIGVNALAGDAAGRALAVGNVATAEPDSFEESFALYDVHGQLLWDVRPSTRWQHRPVSELSKLVDYGDGSWLIAGQALDLDAPDSEPMVPGHLLAFRLDVRGRVLWSRRFDAESAWLLAGMKPDADGNVYPAAHPLSVYRLDREGACFERAIAREGDQPILAIRSLHLSPSGIKYFVADDGELGALSR